MDKYVTVQGDMWDGIAYKVYGDETKMSELIQANVRHKDIYVFPAGIELDVPETVSEDKAVISGTVPVWRTD